MKIAILYHRVFELDGSRCSIGGIQKYLLCLGELIHEMGWEPTIFQLATVDFTREVGNVTIAGRAGESIESPGYEIGAHLVHAAGKWIGEDEGMIVFGSDCYYVTTSLPSIVIQHGVAWDIPNGNSTGLPVALQRFLPRRFHAAANDGMHRLRDSRMNQLRRAWQQSGDREMMMQQSIRYMVCVDYNYLNVQKAQGKDTRATVWIIPNFAVPSPLKSIAPKWNGSPRVKIIFARRFVWYRGTRLIAAVFKRLLSSNPCVEITFAGEGPDEQWLRTEFTGSHRVSFTTYPPNEAQTILAEHDIAVVPSLGSEGTSLSAIEAMAAGCAVVGSCVGGLTNIIIDDYNGRLVMPREDDLFAALSEVAADPALRHRLGRRGYETVLQSFTLEVWREKWRRALLHVAQAPA